MTTGVFLVFKSSVLSGHSGSRSKELIKTNNSVPLYISDKHLPTSSNNYLSPKSLTKTTSLWYGLPRCIIITSDILPQLGKSADFKNTRIKNSWKNKQTKNVRNACVKACLSLRLVSGPWGRVPYQTITSVSRCKALCLKGGSWIKRADTNPEIEQTSCHKKRHTE